MMDMTKQVGPFVGIAQDATRRFPNGRTFRFLVYGAYNAGGLIGPEKNGIAVLDDDNKCVLVDEIECAGSGYSGPSAAQLEKFTQIVSEAFSYDDLCQLVNNSNRARSQL